MKQEQFVSQALSRDDIDGIRQQTILVALSGGADSVALLRVLLAAGCDCRAAHCNFHLRGEESMRDERFVRDLCKRLDVPLTIKDFDIAAWQQEHGGSTEMACRQLRYDWFEQVRQQEGCTLIAVAHHADDQVETFFLNLLRGTGAKGLAGMQRLNGHIWRPLLNVTRADILAYLESIGQDYVTDSTNGQNDYRRNRLRNLVLPIVEQAFPGGTARILDTMQNLSLDHQLLMSLVDEYIPDYQNIDINKVYSLPCAPTLLYHRLRHLGFNRDQCSHAIDAARQGHGGRQFTARSHRLVVNRQSLTVEQIEQIENAEIPFDAAAGTVSPIHISVQRGDAPFTPRMCSGNNRVAFDTQLLNCERIVLRHWRRGDRIQPFGMRGSKLVSDLFNDLKLDHADKRDAWLLEADGKIIWVVGHRSSIHFPVPNESQDYLIMTLLQS